jgi:hypothetical protein
MEKQIIEKQIIERQKIFYNYIIKSIDEFIEHKTNSLKILLNNLYLLHDKSKYIFEDVGDLHLLNNGYKNNNITILLYLKYKFLLFIEQNENI